MQAIHSGDIRLVVGDQTPASRLGGEVGPVLPSDNYGGAANFGRKRICLRITPDVDGTTRFAYVIVRVTGARINLNPDELVAEKSVVEDAVPRRGVNVVQEEAGAFDVARDELARIGLRTRNGEPNTTLLCPELFNN
jgi:hypothetical protein